MADSTYKLKIEVIKNTDAVYGTGYDKDKIITPSRTQVLLDVKIEADTLEDILGMASYQVGGVKE